MDEQDAIARKVISTNKNSAKAALRRKKVFEKHLEMAQNQIGQIEQNIYSIEAANINHETLTAMKEAGAAMAKIHNGLTPEKVDEAMEIIREQQVIADEIATAISSNPLGEAIDEGDLETELENMEQEAIDVQMLNTGPVPVSVLPSAANGEIKGKARVEEEDEEAELAKLRAEMAM